MSFFKRSSSLLMCACLAGCSLILDFPEEGSLNQGGDPQGAGDPSGGTGGTGGSASGGGPLGGGGGGGGGSPACLFEPTFDWSFTLGTVEPDIYGKMAEGIDADGDLWVAGQLASGELFIAGNAVVSSGDGEEDLYLIEIDPEGVLKRGFVFGGVGWAFVRDLAFAPDGTISLVGAFAGDMTFGPGGPTIIGTPQADLTMSPAFEEYDGWVAIFDPASETFPYAKAYGADDGVYQAVTSVVFDSVGDLLVVGSVDEGVMDWGSGGPVMEGVSVAKLDPTLSEVWKRHLNTGYALPGHLALLPDDSFVVAATTNVANVFGQSAQGEVSYGSADAFVAHYASNGDWIWHRIFGDVDEQTATNLVVGPSGDVYVAGTFKIGIKEKVNTVWYEGAETGYETEDIFFARLATADAGNTVWHNRIYGLGYQEAQEIVVGCGERLYIAGDISDQGFPGVDFGDGQPVATEGTTGHADLFYATYDGDNGGAYSSHRRVGDDYVEVARGMLLDPAGGFLLVGAFFDTVSFDSAIGGDLQNSLASDIFVVRYSGAQ